MSRHKQTILENMWYQRQFSVAFKLDRVSLDFEDWDREKRGRGLRY